MSVVTGGCLCGGVRYEVRGRFLRANHCHCSRCRRHTGTAHSTQGRVRREDFRLVQGAELVRSYVPGGGATKAFCSVCGSSLFGGSWPEGDEVTIRLGSVDGDPGIRPQFHTFVGSKAGWWEITDDLPQYPEGPPPRPMSTAQTSGRSASHRCAWSVPTRIASTATTTASAANRARG